MINYLGACDTSMTKLFDEAKEYGKTEFLETTSFPLSNTTIIDH